MSDDHTARCASGCEDDGETYSKAAAFRAVRLGVGEGLRAVLEIPGEVPKKLGSLIERMETAQRREPGR
jgi:hypothetical protein